MVNQSQAVQRVRWKGRAEGPALAGQVATAGLPGDGSHALGFAPTELLSHRAGFAVPPLQGRAGHHSGCQMAGVLHNDRI